MFILFLSILFSADIESQSRPTGHEYLSIQCSPDNEECEDQILNLISCPLCLSTKNLAWEYFVTHFRYLGERGEEMDAQEFYQSLETDRYLALHHQTIYLGSLTWKSPVLSSELLFACAGFYTQREALPFLLLDLDQDTQKHLLVCPTDEGDRIFHWQTDYPLDTI